MRVAIIGAGMAGLACARRLHAAKHEVVVFDKGRGPGGRMSTRRVETPAGEVTFDHGAQYLTVRDERFGRLMTALSERGHVARWLGRFVEIARNGRVSPAEAKDRLVGTPGMNAIIRAMAAGLDVRFASRATRLSGRPGNWTVGMEDGEPAHGFDAVAVAVPADQAAPLVDDVAPDLAADARKAVIAPNWTLMAVFESPLPVEWDGAIFDGEILGWAARNRSKPGRTGPETWVVQAQKDWSRAHVEGSPEDAAKTLLAEFAGITGHKARPIHATAHRWRYAFVEKPAKGTHAWRDDIVLGTCGDWHVGPRVECAWISGHELAGAILSS